MVGLVPTIHVFASLIERGVQDVDARHKGEHDGWEQRSKFHVPPRRPLRDRRGRRLEGAPK